MDREEIKKLAESKLENKVQFSTRLSVETIKQIEEAKKTLGCPKSVVIETAIALLITSIKE